MTAPPSLTLDGCARIGALSVFGPLRLDLPAGRITCLLGPSGVGKTTLLRLIAGVDEVTEFTGTITASDGVPLPGRMALMAQGDMLMPWLDVLGNVTLGARLRGMPRDTARAREMHAECVLVDDAPDLGRIDVQQVVGGKLQGGDGVDGGIGGAGGLKSLQYLTDAWHGCSESDCPQSMLVPYGTLAALFRPGCI